MSAIILGLKIVGLLAALGIIAAALTAIAAGIAARVFMDEQGDTNPWTSVDGDGREAR